MSLTEIMSGAGLSIYAQVALLLFLVAFILILSRVFAPHRKSEWTRAALMPFDDETSRTSPPPRTRGGE